MFRFCCRIHFGLLNLRLQALYGSTCTLYFFFYSKLMLIRFNNINLSKCWRGDVLRNAVTDLKNLIGKQTYGQINWNFATTAFYYPLKQFFFCLFILQILKYWYLFGSHARRHEYTYHYYFCFHFLHIVSPYG